jgi:hypothetical protein
LSGFLNEVFNQKLYEKVPRRGDRDWSTHDFNCLCWAKLKMANEFFPFYDLGLKCNPFRALSDEEWVEVAVVPRQVQGVLESGFENLQILGEKGYGKTTMLLLLARERRYESQLVAYERIPEDGRVFKTELSGFDWFVLDEAQRLSKRERKRFMRESVDCGLIIGNHEDFGDLFGSAGRGLTTVSLAGTDRDHLAAVLNRRLAYFALEERMPEPIGEEMVDFLWGRFGRNIRAVEG